MATAAAPAATTNSMTGPNGVVATPNANASLAEVSNGATALAGQGFKASTTAAPAATSSPTVMSDANIRENVIPDIINTASKYMPSTNTPVNGTQNGQQNNGSTNTQTGTQTPSTTSTGTDTGDTSYEDVFSKVFGGLQSEPTDPNTANSLNTLAAMRSSHDAGYNTQIANLTSQYNQLIQQTTAAQSNAQQVEQNFLLKNGAARNSTGPNAMLATINGQINSLASLSAKENSAIAAVQTAMNNSDYKEVQQAQTILDKVTADKKALAEKITASTIAQNTKLNAAQVQSTKDNEIAKIFSSGITDPTAILNAVDPSLGITDKDIANALKTISNGDLEGLTGNVKNFYALKEAGALPGDISKLPPEQQLEAYLNLNKKTSTAADATKPLYTTKGGTAITKNDIAGGTAALDASKGSDGYVDPNLYEAMYNKWEAAGLDPANFIKNYPPKLYINPANTTLPTYLQTGKTAKAGTTPANPFK